MLQSSRGGQLQDGRRHSLPLPTCFSVLEFLAITDDNGVYHHGLSQLTKTLSRFKKRHVSMGTRQLRLATGVHACIDSRSLIAA